MTPDQIQFTRELLAALPEEDERPILARAAAEFLRLHDAIERLYKMTPNDVQREAAFLDVRPGILADTVEQIVRRFLQ
jgi:hypothetical protein